MTEGLLRTYLTQLKEKYVDEQVNGNVARGNEKRRYMIGERAKNRARRVTSSRSMAEKDFAVAIAGLD